MCTSDDNVMIILISMAMAAVKYAEEKVDNVHAGGKIMMIWWWWWWWITGDGDAVQIPDRGDWREAGGKMSGGWEWGRGCPPDHCDHDHDIMITRLQHKGKPSFVIFFCEVTSWNGDSPPPSHFYEVPIKLFFLSIFWARKKWFWRVLKGVAKCLKGVAKCLMGVWNK